MTQSNPGTRISLRIISLIARGPKTFGQLSQALNQPTSATLSRNLKVLIEEGWVVKGEDQLYRAGRELGLTSSAYLSGETGSPQLSPLVAQLAEESGQSAAFALWQGEGILFTAKKEMSQSFHYISLGEINRHNSYNGFNITCLAYQSRGEEILAEPPLLGTVFSNDSEIAPCLEKIREERFYLSRDTVIRMTAPVFYENNDSLFAGVLGISLIPAELSPEEIARYRNLVIHSAENAGNILSGRKY